MLCSGHVPWQQLCRYCLDLCRTHFAALSMTGQILPRCLVMALNYGPQDQHQ